MKAVKRYFKENIGILAALLVMIAFLCIYPRTSTTFPTKTNIFNVLRQSAPNVLLSCGMTFARVKKALCRMVLVRLPMPISMARSIALMVYSWMSF